MRTEESEETGTPKCINGNQGTVKGYSFLRPPDANRPEDLSLFHSLTCKNNAILFFFFFFFFFSLLLSSQNKKSYKIINKM